MTQVTFREGPKKRNELRLPILHYVVADDWIRKLGEKAFCAWLQFHTWVDRRSNSEVDKIPYTLESVAEKLGVSKATLYRTIIRPLWEYGLIDLVEYESTNRKTQKPVNIIVYESPKNKHETKVMPLVKLRDWKDYGSSAQIYGLKGGRPKTRGKQDPSNNPETKNDNTDRFNNETVHGFKNETVHGFENKTVTVSKMKPNNDTNNNTHDQSKHTNDSNNHHHHNSEENREENQEPDQKVVVSEKEIEYVLRHIEYHQKEFKQSLTRKQAERLIRICKKYGKNVGDVIENTRLYFKWERQKRKGKGRPDDLMSALIYDVQKGWEIPVSDQESQQYFESENEFSFYNWVYRSIGS